MEYQIKFTLCLLLFYCFYKLVLEKQSFHHFKRYYLLLSIPIAAVIPLINLTIPEQELLVQSFNHTVNEASGVLVKEGQEMISARQIPWLQIIYFILLLPLIGRFIWQIRKLILQIVQNTRVRTSGSIYVLMENPVSPHTFLNYVFLNKDQYLKNGIPNEVLKHEDTHAGQWHSLDIIFIELICILLWFNPVLYLFRGPIRLNHEFLADSEVLKNGVSKFRYWETLMLYSTSKEHRHIANAFNFSSIKKRLVVMKKKTSNHSAFIRQAGVISLLFVALFCFGNTVESELKSIESKEQTVPRNKNQSTLADSESLNKSIEDTSVSTSKNQTSTSKKLLSNNPAERSVDSHENVGLSPLEFIVEMQDQDAIFFYNDQTISPDDAVILIQHANKIDLVAMHTGLEHPVVKLSNAQMPDKYKEILLLYDP